MAGDASLSILEQTGKSGKPAEGDVDDAAAADNDALNIRGTEAGEEMREGN